VSITKSHLVFETFGNTNNHIFNMRANSTKKKENTLSYNRKGVVK
jgi:hypothetical protein